MYLFNFLSLLSMPSKCPINQYKAANPIYTFLGVHSTEHSGTFSEQTCIWLCCQSSFSLAAFNIWTSLPIRPCTIYVDNKCWNLRSIVTHVYTVYSAWGYTRILSGTQSNCRVRGFWLGSGGVERSKNDFQNWQYFIVFPIFINIFVFHPESVGQRGCNPKQTIYQFACLEQMYS